MCIGDHALKLLVYSATPQGLITRQKQFVVPYLINGAAHAVLGDTAIASAVAAARSSARRAHDLVLANVACMNIHIRRHAQKE